MLHHILQCLRMLIYASTSDLALDMEMDINSVILEEFGQKLLDARTRKGLSQRALAERTDIPQAHISKIEQGRVNIRLSSLVELARALDLDVQLLPRQALPAVEGAVRAIENEAGDSAESRALATLAQQERALEHISAAYPNLGVVQNLLPTIKELKLGSVTLGNVPLAFADVPPFTVFGVNDKPALLLGTDLLETFRRVSLDFHARKVRFQLRRCGSEAVAISTSPTSTISRLSSSGDRAVCS